MTIEKPRIRVKAKTRPTRKAFFCWEMSYSGRWTPCIYYDESPSDYRDGGKVNRSTIYQVASDLDFPALRRLHPAPALAVPATAE